MGAEMLFTCSDPHCSTGTITAACRPSGIALSSTTRSLGGSPDSCGGAAGAWKRAAQRRPLLTLSTPDPRGGWRKRAVAEMLVGLTV